MDPIVRDISPSQIKAKRICFRRMAFRYVEGRKDPAGPAAVHGGQMHTQLEEYLLRGRTPTHEHARSVIRTKLIPKPLTCLPEHRMSWNMGHPWSYQGIMDVSGALISKALMRTSPFVQPGDPLLIEDFKFTSNLKYALVEKDGVLIDHETNEIDPQSTMYAAKYMITGGHESVTGLWAYTRTKGKTKTIPVWVDFKLDRVLEGMEAVHKDAAEIHQLYQIRPKAADVPYNTDGCYAFFQPCPFQAVCVRPTHQFESDIEGDDSMGFAEDMMKNFPGDEPPPLDSDEAPPLEDESPELPPEDERDAPGEEETEALVAAEIQKQRAEKGFVNPPEAPEAPTTPEEAFEAFGDPVVEKFKFTKEHVPALRAACAKLGVEAPKKAQAASLAKALRLAGHNPEEFASDVIVPGEVEPPVPDEVEVVTSDFREAFGSLTEEQRREVIERDAPDIEITVTKEPSGEYKAHRVVRDEEPEVRVMRGCIMIDKYGLVLHLEDAAKLMRTLRDALEKALDLRVTID